MIEETLYYLGFGQDQIFCRLVLYGFNWNFHQTVDKFIHFLQELHCYFLFHELSLSSIANSEPFRQSCFQGYFSRLLYFFKILNQTLVSDFVSPDFFNDLFQPILSIFPKHYNESSKMLLQLPLMNLNPYVVILVGFHPSTESIGQLYKGIADHSATNGLFCLNLRSCWLNHQLLQVVTQFLKACIEHRINCSRLI